MFADISADKFVGLLIRLGRTGKYNAGINLLRGGKMVLSADTTAGTVYMCMAVNYHCSFPEKPLQSKNL
jgi:hypothetical protein